ncbi:MAG TPA: hypothetical protein PKC39_13960 [Ferruginibacter sp.]|nr:hypothetical protein [Ferruginibacter sp.]HMP22061.1 hypothetical protein [Ferruginibacter sp.]
MIVNMNDVEPADHDAGGGQMWKYQGNYFTGMIEEYINGVLRGQIEVQNGRTEGIIKHFYPNGQIEQEYSLHNNGLHGIFKEWDENGNLISETNWVNGVRV